MSHFLEEMYLKVTEDWLEMMSVIEGDNYSLASVPANEHIIRGVPLSENKNAMCCNRDHRYHYLPLLLLPPPHHKGYQVLIFK